jgi:membrane-associated phospholipid phosphatase
VVAASLVGLSTLYTKQHYVLDVAAGVLLAVAACAVFLHGLSRKEVSELDRRVAPVLALGLFGFLAILVASSWLVYVN